ncbi:GNAT family N-acetyltransferase [Afifella sp. YEN Y35]|uniref:GNAT family N-acetyltransferase n=1 Tax=Afifella sp. YEN Y35 TaxID=3388337 RepID=UPI0039DF634D
MTDILLEPFSDAHLEAAVRLSQAENWPHRTEDWAMVAAVSQGFVATKDGRVVGTAFSTPFGPDLATIDMIIVDNSLRGQGLGRRLVEAAIETSGSRNLRLVATEDGLPLYKKLGFGERGGIVQHQGKVASATPSADVEVVRDTDHDAIIDLDRAAYGGDRRALLGQLFAAGGEAVVLRDKGSLSGFGICRPFGRGRVIGPVVAANIEAARNLILALIERHAGEFLRIDTRRDTGLSSWLTDLGLPETGSGVAMARGEEPRAIRHGEPKTFALVSQAFG